MSNAPSTKSHAVVADTSLKTDSVNAPEITQQEKPDPLRRAVKTWLDMLVTSTSRRS